jgi:hypothetical protein
MDTPPSSPRRKGQEIVRAYKRKQQIKSLVIGLTVGLLVAGVVGLLIWQFSKN